MFSQPHKFVFTCNCKNNFFITAENLSRDHGIICPNCKYEMPKTEAEHVINAAKEINKIDEANDKIDNDSNGLFVKIKIEKSGLPF